MQISSTEIEAAGNINLLDYLQSIGENIVRDGANYYRHQEHQSLVINIKKNFFSWNSKGVSGNAITYLMKVHNLSFQDSVRKINGDIDNKNIKKYEPIKPVYLEKFSYDIKPGKNTKNVENYLINERKIDEQIVKQLIESGYIEEDIYKNVVFKWKENEEIIGASLQGTTEIPLEKRKRPDRAYFKKILPTTELATYSGFSITKGYPENLYFFESPIDLLSYLSLNKRSLSNCKLQSMDGLKEKSVVLECAKAIKYLKNNHKKLKSVNLCVDNDDAGKKFVNKLEKHHYSNSNKEIIPIKGILPNLPCGMEKWDWNDELKIQVKMEISKQPEKNLLEAYSLELF